MSAITLDNHFEYRSVLATVDRKSRCIAAAHERRAMRRRTVQREEVISTKMQGARSHEARKSRCRLAFMNPNPALASLCNADLLSATRDILRRGCIVEADLLVHLAEIEERKLHLEMACPTMFAFCVMKLGFSEDATYNRLGVARAARQFPAMLDALRSGEVHLSGLRVLVPRLTAENHHQVLARARGKSKREIEELVAALAPKPPVPDAMRKLPSGAPSETGQLS